MFVFASYWLDGQKQYQWFFWARKQKSINSEDEAAEGGGGRDLPQKANRATYYSSTNEKRQMTFHALNQTNKPPGSY